MTIIGVASYKPNRYSVVLFGMTGNPELMIQGAGNTMDEVYTSIRKFGKKVDMCSAQVFNSITSTFKGKYIKELDCLQCTEIIYGSGKPKRKKK